MRTITHKKLFIRSSVVSLNHHINPEHNKYLPYFSSLWPPHWFVTALTVGSICPLVAQGGWGSLGHLTWRRCCNCVLGLSVYWTPGDRAGKEHVTMFFSVMPCDGTRGNEHQMETRKFHFNIWRSFPVRQVKPVESLSLDKSKIQLNAILCNRFAEFWGQVLWRQILIVPWEPLHTICCIFCHPHLLLCSHNFCLCSILHTWLHIYSVMLVWLLLEL